MQLPILQMQLVLLAVYHQLTNPPTTRFGVVNHAPSRYYVKLTYSPGANVPWNSSFSPAPTAFTPVLAHHTHMRERHSQAAVGGHHVACSVPFHQRPRPSIRHGSLPSSGSPSPQETLHTQALRAASGDHHSARTACRTSPGSGGVLDGMRTARALLAIGRAVEMEYKAEMCKKNIISVP